MQGGNGELIMDAKGIKAIEKRGWIYALVDPRHDDPKLRIRYIGKTAEGLDRRLKRHLKEATLSKERCHRLNWIRSMIMENQNIHIEGIHEVPREELNALEIKEIGHFRSIGCSLVNETEGGDGMFGWIPNHETRKKMSESASKRRASEETRALLSRIRRGKNGRHHSQETKTKISLARQGMRLSEDHKRKISERLKCQIKSEVTKEKNRLSNIGSKSHFTKLTWDQVNTIRREYSGTHGEKAGFARNYGVSKNTIGRLLRQESWPIR